MQLVQNAIWVAESAKIAIKAYVNIIISNVTSLLIEPKLKR